MIGHHKGRFCSSFILLAVLGLAVGCSGSGDDLEREEVSGTVTLDGTPLATGSISFSPTGPSTGSPGQTGGGGVISGGKFTIARDVGLSPGNYNVSIFASDKPAERTKPAQAGGGKPSELAKELIPAKYNAKTELKAEIKKGGGNNNLTFSLESK
jgi:hypothetical protein